MQYKNPDGKWQEEIPYIIINLEYNKDIYLGKDTIVAYAWEEDKTCEYLKVNEIRESAEFKNWISTKGKSIVESDLVFSSSGYRTPSCGAEGSRYIPRNQREVRKTEEESPKDVFSK